MPDPIMLPVSDFITAPEGSLANQLLLATVGFLA